MIVNIENYTVQVTGSLTAKRGTWHAIIRWKIDDGGWELKWNNLRLKERGNKKNAESEKERLVDEKVEELTKAIYKKKRINPKFGEMIYGDFLIEWLEIERIRSKWQPSTYKGYYDKIHNIVAPYFNSIGIPVSEINEDHIIAFYEERMEKGNSASSIHKYHANILKSLNYAVRVKAIEKNPVDKFELPSIEKAVIDYLSMIELHQVMDAVRGTNIEMPVMIALMYGLRRSEVIGLKWSAIDFERKTLSVIGKVVAVKVEDDKRGLLFDNKGKTASSTRVLPLLPQIEQLLVKHKGEVKSNREFFGNTYCTDYEDFICVNNYGQLIKPDYCSTHFKRLIKRLGINKNVTFHGLRHSCASLLLHLGYDVKEIQVWLGHSNYQITADIYAHVDMRSKMAMGDKLSESFSNFGKKDLSTKPLQKKQHLCRRFKFRGHLKNENIGSKTA